MELDVSPFDSFFSRTLPPIVSLEMVDSNGTVVFSTTGKWLYPLFELELFIKNHSLNPKEYFLHDRIAGKAAAALTYRLGFKNVKADMMSSLAAHLYDKHNIHYSYEVLVDRILCQTETLFEHLDDEQEIYSIVESRRAKSS